MGLREPLRHRFEGRVLRLTPAGRYSIEEFCGLVDGALADPVCPLPVDLLIDTRDSEVVRTSAELRRAVRFLAGHAERIGRVAVVAPRDVMYGLNRVASVYAEHEGIELEPFRTEEEALLWLARAGEDA